MGKNYTTAAPHKLVSKLSNTQTPQSACPEQRRRLPNVQEASRAEPSIWEVTLLAPVPRDATIKKLTDLCPTGRHTDCGCSRIWVYATDLVKDCRQSKEAHDEKLVETNRKQQTAALRVDHPAAGCWDGRSPARRCARRRPEQPGYGKNGGRWPGRCCPAGPARWESAAEIGRR